MSSSFCIGSGTIIFLCPMQCERLEINPTYSYVPLYSYVPSYSKSGENFKMECHLKLKNLSRLFKSLIYVSLLWKGHGIIAPDFIYYLYNFFGSSERACLQVIETYIYMNIL